MISLDTELFKVSLKKTLKDLIKPLAKFLIFALGYSYTEEDINKFKRSQVIIYPHTSKFECFLLCLFTYLFEASVCFPVTEDYMNIFPLGHILSFHGGFNVGKKGTNNTERMVSYLQKNRKALIISPEGKLAKPEKWSTGFYHTARQCNMFITIAGIDFINHKIVIMDGSFYPKEINENMSASLKEEIYKEDIARLMDKFSKSNIYPMKPDNLLPTMINNTGLKPSYFNEMVPIYWSLFIIVFTIGLIVF